MTFETIYEVKVDPNNDDDTGKYVFVKRTSSDKLFVEYGILYVYSAFTRTGIKKTIVYEFCTYSSVKSKIKDRFYGLLKREKIDVVDKEYMDKVISGC